MNNKLIKFAFEYVTKFSDNRHEDQEAFCRQVGEMIPMLSHEQIRQIKIDIQSLLDGRRFLLVKMDNWKDLMLKLDKAMASIHEKSESI